MLRKGLQGRPSPLPGPRPSVSVVLSRSLFVESLLCSQLESLCAELLCVSPSARVDFCWQLEDGVLERLPSSAIGVAISWATGSCWALEPGWAARSRRCCLWGRRSLLVPTPQTPGEGSLLVDSCSLPRRHFKTSDFTLHYYNPLLLQWNNPSTLSTWTNLHVSVCEISQFSPSVVSDSLQSHGLQHARPPCPSPTVKSLLKLMSIESVMPSNHLILCRPLSFCLQSLPASVSFHCEIRVA